MATRKTNEALTQLGIEEGDEGMWNPLREDGSGDEQEAQKETLTETGKTPKEPIIVEVGGEAKEYEELDEQAGRPKIWAVTRGPTKAEKEEHEATHLLYRAWCKHCVRGRGMKTPH